MEKRNWYAGAAIVALLGGAVLAGYLDSRRRKEKQHKLVYAEADASMANPQEAQSPQKDEPGEAAAPKAQAAPGESSIKNQPEEGETQNDPEQ